MIKLFKKALAFIVYTVFGYVVIGGLTNYALWSILFALPMGVFLGATWYAIDFKDF